MTPTLYDFSQAGRFAILKTETTVTGRVWCEGFSPNGGEADRLAVAFEADGTRPISPGVIVLWLPPAALGEHPPPSGKRRVDSSEPPGARPELILELGAVRGACDIAVEGVDANGRIVHTDLGQATTAGPRVLRGTIAPTNPAAEAPGSAAAGEAFWPVTFGRLRFRLHGSAAAFRIELLRLSATDDLRLVAPGLAAPDATIPGPNGTT